MAHSMTAFSTCSAEYEWGEITWELKSLNHRYLEQAWYLPEEMVALEPELRKHLKNKLSRGQVTAHLRCLLTRQGSEKIGLCRPLVEQLRQVHASLRNMLNSDARADIGKEASNYEYAPSEVMRFMHWPGVVVKHALDLDLVKKDVLGLFDQALDSFTQARAEEGEGLKQFVQKRLLRLDQAIEQIKQLSGALLSSQQEKFKRQWEKLPVEIDTDLSSQVVAIWLQKLDVSEEIARLSLHSRTMSGLLEASGPIGRKLDFFIQELNREVNTIGAKSAHSEVTQIVVELKVWIEQMREQVQNIE